MEDILEKGEGQGLQEVEMWKEGGKYRRICRGRGVPGG